MDAEYFIVYDSSDRETIETLNELFPEFQTVSSLAFVVESVYPIDRTTLMISAQQEKILRIFDLISQKQAYNF